MVSYPSLIAGEDYHKPCDGQKRGLVAKFDVYSAVQPLQGDNMCMDKNMKVTKTKQCSAFRSYACSSLILAHLYCDRCQLNPACLSIEITQTGDNPAAIRSQN
jgi:hypothetical protein